MVSSNLTNELVAQWKKIITSTSFNPDGPNYFKVAEWYYLLTKEQKEDFDDFLTQNINSGHNAVHDEFYMTAHHITSKKICDYFVHYVKTLMSKGEAALVRTDHLTLIGGYPLTAELKDIFCYFLNQEVNESLRVVALQCLSKSAPELALDFIPKVRSFYQHSGTSYLYTIYKNLFDHFSENFPKIFVTVAQQLTKAELTKILSNIPVILSSKSWDDKREKIILELENLFNTKIERKLKF